MHDPILYNCELIIVFVALRALLRIAVQSIVVVIGKLSVEQFVAIMVI